jgi:hypothetical protein
LFKNGVWVSEEDSPLKGTMFAAQNVEPAIVAVRSKGVFESGACTADIRDISCVPVVPIVNLLSIFTPPFRITD